MTDRTSPWDTLVTTALLGTDRRPLPDGLPEPVARLAAAQADRALAVLDAAAGYLSLRHAGARPGSRPEPPPAPRQRLDPAPEAAQVLLGRLLRERDPALVDQWLARCTTRGLGVRAGLWAPLAAATAARGGPDRALVRAALGERGRAFLAANPRWRALAAEPAAADEPSADPAWTPELTAQALTLVEVSGTLRRRVRVSPDARLVGRTVAGADLDAWRAHTGLAPADLLDLLLRERPERLDALVAALADATVRQRHRAWAVALVAAGFARDDLVALVPTDRFAALARDWVRGNAPDRAAHLLATLPGPWDDAVAQTALRLLASGTVGQATSRRVLPAVAVRLPVAVLPDIADLAEAERDGEPVAGFVEAERLLGLRLDIDRTFRTHDPQEHP
jgi:hypothetical protein